MKILLLLLIIVTMAFGETSEPSPDFNPRSLHNSLKKITGDENYHKEELAMQNPDSYGSMNGKFFRVICGSGNVFFVYLGRVNSCRASGCSINAPLGEFEFFDYYTIYDSNYKVNQVRVYNYEASHGQEITARGWLKQFIGYQEGNFLEVGKNVDAISGATISVNGIVNDVKEKTVLLHNQQIKISQRVAE
jgi:hypothetical protein